MNSLCSPAWSSRPVLYIEDEPSDAFFMRLAFEEMGHLRLQIATNGQQALDYLTGKELYTDRERFPLPSLILLDLKLPVLSGWDVLRWLRDQPRFLTLAIVVFSSSPRAEERDRALRMGADEYLTKPSSGLRFTEVARALVARWIAPSERPHSQTRPAIAPDVTRG